MGKYHSQTQSIPEKDWSTATHHRNPQGGPGHHAEALWDISSRTKRMGEQVWWGSQWVLFLVLHLLPTMPNSETSVGSAEHPGML